MKPVPLWTGKQVLIGELLRHVTLGAPPLTHDANAKVPANYWGGDDSGEGAFVVRRDYVCAGVLDKSLFGKHGLVHAVAELHGRVMAGGFISVLSRLLTAHLQLRHDLRDDLLLKRGGGGARRGAGRGDGRVPRRGGDVRRGGRERAGCRAPRTDRLAAVGARGSGGGAGHAQLGRAEQSASATVAQCLHRMARKPFPKNCLSLMTQSGAKGSMVNFSQIAACLGQQELEGRRVPHMLAARRYPALPAARRQPRAGGVHPGPLLLRPAAAGVLLPLHGRPRGRRVDTAVKTGRSGYLQRCLVKTLEALRVHYDHTVRDCDGAETKGTLSGDAPRARAIAAECAP